MAAEPWNSLTVEETPEYAAVVLLLGDKKLQRW
jgi:hypothetical protein